MEADDDLQLYSLLLPPGTVLEAEKLALALQDDLGLHRSEAIPRARYGGGILANRESHRRLEKLATTIEELGSSSSIVESMELENLPRPRRTSGLDFSEEELTVQAPGGKGVSIQRSSLGAIRALALLPENPPPEEEDTDSSPLGSSILEDPRENLQQEEYQRRLQLLVERLNDPELRGISFQLRVYSKAPPAVLKIDKDEFDYSCLGKIKSDNSLENYLRLLEKLLGWLPGAEHREQVEDFLDDPDPRAILLSGGNEAACTDRSILWHLQNAAAGETSRKTTGPSRGAS